MRYIRASSTLHVSEYSPSGSPSRLTNTGFGLHFLPGYDNDRLRHIRLHEQVNELPDANYATLKFFMGHLDK